MLDLHFFAAALQLMDCRIPASANAVQRRMILERAFAMASDPEIRAVALRLLALDDDALQPVVRLIALVADSQILWRQPVPRQDTGPPAPRHVATPIVAHAPPARLLTDRPGRPDAERRAA